MPDLKEQFEKQNKILDIYMRNASIGIVVIECNDKKTGMQICEYLHTSYCLQRINFMNLKEGIVEFFRKKGSSKSEQEKYACIYNFPTNSSSVDVVKSLNISRELLKNMIRLVFIMPTFLVNQIQRYEPNLRDYIGLFLEYREKIQVPFEPEYDAPFAKYFRKTQDFNVFFERKDTYKDPLRRVYAYAEALSNYCVITKESMENNVWPTYMEAIQQIHQSASQEEKTKLEADISYRMALALSKQEFYEKAKSIFQKILIRASEKENTGDFAFLQGVEGIAYSEYGLGNYEEAEKQIVHMIQLQEKNGEGITQICRTKNNLAACYMQTGKYDQAIEILEECNIGRMEHELYVKKNLMICYMITAERDIDLHMDMWEKITENAKTTYGADSVWYAECMLIDAWCQGILLGKCDVGVLEAEKAVKIEKNALGGEAEEVVKAQKVLQIIRGKLYN